MNLTLKNPSNLPLFWMLLGQKSDGTVCWADVGGTLHPVKVGDDCTIYQSHLERGVTIRGLTTLLSARVVFTLGQPLEIAIVTDGNGRPNVQDAVFWNPADPNYTIIWDKIEFSLVGGQVWANTTQVDYFSLPMVVEVANATTKRSSAPLAVSRDDVFAAFAATPPFDRLIVAPAIRILAPGYAPTFPAGYLDPAIAAAWTYLAANPLTLSLDGAPAGYTSATGSVVDGVLSMTDNTGFAYTIARPSTQDVFLCNGALSIDGSLPAVNQQVDGILKRQVGAALNRSVVTSLGAWCDGDGFYASEPTNTYSKRMHASFVGGACYGFAYDDVCNRYSSSISVPQASKMTVTVGSL